MSGPVLVELCAGSAAVSLRWLSSRAVPPLAYMGSKRGYADAILTALGLPPGGGARSGRVVLVEPGPWGEAWSLWRTAEGRRDTCERLRAWAGEDPRELWERLRAAPVPTETSERVAAWAVLVFWTHGSGSCRADGARWRMGGGFNASMAYAVAYRERVIAAGRDFKPWSAADRRLPFLVDAINALPMLRGVDVHHADARTISPIPDALVYIDPPYDGTTGYGFALPRADVLALAAHWRDAGATVAVSEAEPLPLDGGHALSLPRKDFRSQPWSRQQSEWLTISRPPHGQLALIPGAA